MNCERFKLSVDDYLKDRLDRDDRRDFRGHLQTCAQCRAEAVFLEPSLLLASGVPPETDDRGAGECAEAVTALIRQERLRRRLAPPARRWLAAAAVCVMVLGGGLLWRVAPWSADPQEAAVTVADSQGPVEAPAPPPRVEIQMPDSEVRVYQFAGSDSETTAVYFVVSEGMEL
ncbi:MAG: zf-HC2 domain-containing protein [Acidobacteria bacterium]|nr:zf-HC2 domain-containing protein [Acidobacteriota bacterium]